MKHSSFEHEFHLIEMFLKCCGSCFGFDYQKTKIIKSESPDFVLSYDNHDMGVEITRAVDQNLQKATLIRNSKYKDTTFSPTLFEGKDMKSEDIKEWLEKSKKQLHGRPYLNDGLEEQEVRNIIQAIERKIGKFDSYKKFEKNILLVHSKDRATLNHNSVISKLKEYVFENDIKFDYIVLKLGDLFHCFSKNRCEEYCVYTIQA